MKSTKSLTNHKEDLVIIKGLKKQSRNFVSFRINCVRMILEVGEIMNHNPIGILDSGIGGVTVLKEILKLLPNEHYIYYSDSLNNPYGEKSREEVFHYVDKIMKYFIKKGCKVIVFACNTATALTIDEIRKKYMDIPIIGIEPAYKMVHDNCVNKKTLIMATPGTIESKRFLDLYDHYNNGKTILLPCSNLAHLIELEDYDGIKSYLNQTLPVNSGIKVVVLGCTHYPLIKKDIQDVLGLVDFYDGGPGVANRLHQVLKEKKLLSDNQKGSIQFYDSSQNNWKKKRFYELLEKNS